MGKQSLEVEFQVAQIASLMAVASESGLGLVASIDVSTENARGEVAKKFQRIISSLELGGNLFDELEKLRSQSKVPALVELAIKLQVSLQFGTPVSEQLSALTRTIRQRIAQQELTESTKRESLMLLPLVFLILPVTVLFAIFPALKYLNLNY